jgi:PAS domain S-box-containing protein
MAQPLSVLIVEDWEPDAGLAIHALRQGGFDVIHRRVDSREGLRDALVGHAWDVILSDYKLPGFTGAEAVRIVRDSGVDVPLIILSGAIGEESAADLIRLGANALVLKQNLLRLPPTVSRVLAEVASERMRKIAEAALRDSEARSRAIIESAAEAIITADERGVIVSFNPAAESTFGYRADEAIGQNLTYLMPEAYRGRHLRSFAAYLRTGVGNIIGKGPRELEGRRKDGTVFPARLSVSDVLLEGRRLFIGVAEDLTAQKAAEGRLREAQKMEAIGQLTGGVAHDFNNLLTIILGNLQLLGSFHGDDERANKHVDAAITAVNRGADLTKRLLAFARRQVLDPKVLDINKVLATLEDMLHRTLGEDIAVKFALVPDLWPVRIDASELEHALINLATNARDAMPRGGQLTVETANAVLDEGYARNHSEVTAGEYAMVAVTDTGSGIPPELREKVFEPFFTTKEKGKGTGLGLSMVYGFVKQSGGHAKIYSEPGHGTTVKLYFPRAKAEEPPEVETARADRKVAGGSETVLVVEDVAEVRSIAVAALERLGYRVLAAASGPEALEVLDREPRIHLLFTDVVMQGGMNGSELAGAARERLPGLKVLFCSGYAQEGLARSGRIETGSELIMKPYDLATLAKKVRHVLDG